MEKGHQCINCNTEVIGAFCHVCGQKASIRRLTWRVLLDDLQNRLFGFDNTFFRTVRDLTVRPQKVIHSILDGIRVVYIGPVGYYFLMLTVYLLLASILNVDLVEMMGGVSESFQTEDTTEGQKAMNNEVLSTVFNNFRTFSFLMAPFFMLANWLVYRKSGLNFIEHSVVVFYAMAHPFIISNLFVITWYLFGWSPNLFLTLVSTVFYAWVCTSFFSKNKVLGFFKGLLAWLVGYIMIVLLIAVGIVTYLASNPESLKGFSPE